MRRLVFMAAMSMVFGCSDGTRPPADACAAFGPSGCTPDALRAYTCTNGVYREHACDMNQKCSSGACRDFVCAANLFLCDANVAEVCDPTGTQKTRTDCGAIGAICVVEPLTASCQQHACAPSSTFCAPDGSAVRKCALDGTTSDVVQDCADPGQRGNHCVGSTCRDRCALLEAQNRSTLGCRFLTSSQSGSATLLIANPQPDLPATVMVRDLAGGLSTQRSLAASSTIELPWPATGSTGTSRLLRAISLTSTVPVQAWLIEAGDGVSLHPEHALSTSYLVAVDTAGAQTISAVATVDNTSVTATLTGATSAGGAIPAGTAGGTVTSTLKRGEVLTLASSGALTGSRLSASAPISVIVASPSGALTLPGADTLGSDVVVLRPSLVVARDAATVTTELDGTLNLAAGGSSGVQANQRLHATRPVLVIDLGAGGREGVPPVEQWQAALFPAWSGAEATLLLAASAPLTVTAGPTMLPLTASASNTFASTNAPVVMARPLSAPAGFFALVRPTVGTLSGGHGLGAINP